MFRTAFLFICVFLLFGGCQLDTDVKVIKMGHAQVVAHPVHQAMVFLGKRLEEKSGGKIKVKVYPNPSAGEFKVAVVLPKEQKMNIQITVLDATGTIVYKSPLL
jgi:TRAP-type C4-dicarboxylate transport system substrate-binding protein